MNDHETEVGILVPPSPGKIVMVSAVMVGRGLAVTRLPDPVEGEWYYSITHVATGYRLPYAVFARQDLAIRCARELIRRVSFPS